MGLNGDNDLKDDGDNDLEDDGDNDLKDDDDDVMMIMTWGSSVCKRTW